MSEEVKITPNGIKQAIDDLLDENERLNNIINELEKALQLEVIKTRENSEYNKGVVNAFNHTISLISQLKGSNEPSFEEMVGFIENVYKDIKSQSTLHEELEEERKTIAKIVGDFKEVNK